MTAFWTFCFVVLVVLAVVVWVACHIYQPYRYRFATPVISTWPHLNSDVGLGKGILTELSLCYSIV